MLRGQAALLAWAQRCTEGYKGVNITNFTSSWRDGLAFAALVHNHHPESFDYEPLVNGTDALKRLEVAFEAAGKAGVPNLLDPEDVLVGPQPDHFSIMTYLSTYYLPPSPPIHLSSSSYDQVTSLS
jgi:spectrin beta